MELRKNDLIEVHWEDITQHYDWHDELSASIIPAQECYIVGFFLNETERWIRISDMVGADKDRNVTIIPKGCILKIKKHGKTLLGRRQV